MSFAIDNFDETVAFVHVCWPTGTRRRKLPSDLTQLAIYLLRTQNTNMAKFALKHPLIRARLIKLIGKEINKECQGMCRESVKVAIGDEIPEDMAQPRCKRNVLDYHSSPWPVSKKRKQQEGNTESGGKKKFFKKDVCSIFKKTSKDDMSSFSFEKAELEMKERCPMFYTMLKSESISQCRLDDGDVYWKTSIVIAASVCLKNRSQRMTTVQLLISLIINHSSYTLSFNTVFIRSSNYLFSSLIFVKFFTSIAVYFLDLFFSKWPPSIVELWPSISGKTAYPTKIFTRKYFCLYFIFFHLHIFSPHWFD